MDFALPSTLLERIADYDPELKARRAVERQARIDEARRVGNREKAATTKSARFGMPMAILPNTVVPPDQLRRALRIINNSPAADRHEHWLTPDGEFLACLWLITSKDNGDFWFAAWANPARDALYLRIMGERRPRWNTWPELHYVVSSEGRAWYMDTFRFSEKQAIASPDVNDPAVIVCLGLTYQRSACCQDSFRRNTYERVLRYLGELPSRQWKDWTPVTSRYGRHSNPFECITTRPIDIYYGDTCRQSKRHATEAALKDGIDPQCTSLAWLKLPEQARTPWFTRFFWDRMPLIADFLSMSNVQRIIPYSMNELSGQAAEARGIANELRAFLVIWPDADGNALQKVATATVARDDRLQHYAGFLRRGPHHHITEFHGFSDSRVREWINANIPMATWLQWHAAGERLEEVCSQMLRISSHHSLDPCDPLPIERPSRWRFQMFSDVVNDAYIKTCTPNDALPQDLLPQPVSVEEPELGKVTFFQPLNTHQLAGWGAAVRNCVGNSGYAGRVKNHQAFIVLAMVDRKPTFTVQLSLRDGRLHVDQLVGQCNQRPEPHIQNAWSSAFSQALQLASQPHD